MTLDTASFPSRIHKMSGERRLCESCGAAFSVTEREIEEEKIPAAGLHLPADCPEGLDTMCPSCDAGITECKSCRPKQDGQRS